jgi:uncharacterized spore protein YtfJ
MSDEMKEVMDSTTASWSTTASVIEKLFSVTQPGAVFSEPVTVEGRTIITTSEVMIGMGVGYGIGAGSATGEGTEEEEEEEDGDDQEAEAESEMASGEGYGGGGGGGGFSTGRPVAAIIIEPEGVRIEPIVDVTKISLAFFTVLGSIFLMGFRIRRAARG